MFDGHRWIVMPRHKTKVISHIRLLDIPEAILRKYEEKQLKGKLLPIISNQKMNDYLKEIADVCGIRKKITFHAGRHSFATLALGYGVPIETVSKMLGHTNIRTTQVYARITDRKLSDDMEMMARKLNGRSIKNG
jgi:integrase